MKHFFQGEHRDQYTIRPESLDDYIANTNPARIVDVLVDDLALAQLDFRGLVRTGTCHLADLRKIYICCLS